MLQLVGFQRDSFNDVIVANLSTNLHVFSCVLQMKISINYHWLITLLDSKKKKKKNPEKIV
jgi:hypothetical protein